MFLKALKKYEKVTRVSYTTYMSLFKLQDRFSLYLATCPRPLHERKSIHSGLFLLYFIHISSPG